MTSVHERTAQFLDPTARRRRSIVTPEGVALQVEVAEYGERAAAFLLDVAFIIAADVALVLLTGLSLHEGARTRVLLPLAVLIAFLVRALYFVCFELAWRGATPGKRIVGLRVIDRHGGQLRASAIVARNLLRELEAFLPLQALLSIGAVGPGAWSRAALALWLLLLAVLPFCNRDRLRLGDLLAGTLVIAMPKRRLLPDLVEHDVAQEFSDAQLRAYGAFELQILEELLRRPAGAETTALCQDVAERIRRKIGWPAPVPPAQVPAFLRRFYAAERAYLERERLYGRARDEAAAV